jgi:hypothetical protein
MVDWVRCDGDDGDKFVTFNITLAKLWGLIGALQYLD